MKKLLMQLLLFASPVILLLLAPTYILWRSKENFCKIDEVVAGNDKYLIGYAYHEKNYSYLKWEYLQKNPRKKIWAIGSSRVLQFRRQMFDSTFYNVGYTILGVNDFKQFLKSIPKNKYPEYMIMGLDQWMFNAASSPMKSNPAVESWQNSFTLYPKPTSTYKQIYNDLFAGKFSWSSFQSNDSIRKFGLNAVINNKGFRNDGSLYYGDQVKKLLSNDSTASDYHYSNTFQRINAAKRPFEYSEEVNPRALKELGDLLQFCRGAQIKVIAFMPPYADTVYNKMQTSGHYKYLETLVAKVKPVVDRYGFELYDFSSLSSLGSNQQETIDAFHGGEVTYQKMLIQMLAKGSVLNQVTNFERLKTDLLKPRNRYIVYDY